MVKISFVASLTTLFLFAAKTRAVCILYTPNAVTGIVNEQEFVVDWVGCVEPVLVDLWDKDSDTILTDYQGSDTNVGFTIHNGVGVEVYVTLTDADDTKATSITYTVKAGLGGTSIAPLPTSPVNTILSQSSSPPSILTTTNDILPSITFPSFTLPSITLPSISYPTNTKELNSILSGLSKSYGPPTIPGSQPTNSPNNNNSKKSSSHIGVIVGAAVGGVVVLALIAALVFFFVSRSNRRQRDNTPLTQQPTGGEDGMSGLPYMSNAHGSQGPSLNSYPNNAPGAYNPAYNNNQLVGNMPTDNSNGPYNPYPPSHGTDNQSQYTQPQPPSLTGPSQQLYGNNNYNNNVGNTPPVESDRSSPMPHNPAENWNSGHATQGGFSTPMSVQRSGQPFSGAPELS